MSTARNRWSDVYPDPIATSSARAVREAGLDPLDYDLDDAWWANADENPPEPAQHDDGKSYEEYMAANGWVQIWSPELGMRIWKHQ
jgi:hypothetical protein